MPTPTSLSEQVLALPTGPGGVHGLGETFAADPYTGTGRFQIPIPLPPGHAGLQPALALVYASGVGNGVCGIGWSMSAGSIRRRLDKGFPAYTDSDVFVLGDDELVPSGSGRFRRRTEGTFARIEHLQFRGDDLWVVTERDGTRRTYGRDATARDGDGGRITAWQLSELRDTNDNRVTFTYARDRAGRRVYLDTVAWGDGAWQAKLTYATRPDVVRSARAGFVQYTDQRLTRVQVLVRRTSTGVFSEFDRMDLSYDASPVTGLSRLRQVTRTGTHADGRSHVWPALTFGYADPTVGGDVVEVETHPPGSLADPDVSLVDLDGDGFIDILRTTSAGWQLWRHDTVEGFRPPLPIPGPIGARLRDTGVFLSDMRGEGFADLVTQAGFYANDGAGFQTLSRFSARPSFDMESSQTRFLDLNGDGIGDVLVQTAGGLSAFLNTPGVGFETKARVLPRPEAGFPRFSEPTTRFADMDGDGLTDIVRLSRGVIEVWANLGNGRFESARRMPLPEALPADVEPEHMTLIDTTGTGAADLVVRRPGEVWIYPNGCGTAFGAPQRRRVRSLTGSPAVEGVDLRGTGVRGLLLTDDEAWTWYELWQGKRPDALSTVDNGMGATTTIQYASSLRHAAEDRSHAHRWPWPLPYSVMVVDRVETVDSVTGMRSVQRWAYHDGYHDAVEREFRGFARVETWDTEAGAGDSTLMPARTVRFFDVGNGQRPVRFYTAVPATLPADSSPALRDAQRALRGQLIREEVFGEDGTPLRSLPYAVTHHAFAVTPVVGPPAVGHVSYQVARVESLAVALERGRDARIVRSKSTVDRYGRLVETREAAEGRAGTFTTAHESQQTESLERGTRTDYWTLDGAGTSDPDAAYSPTYLVDRPSLITRFGISGSIEITLAKERRFYDGADYEGLGYPGSSTTAGVGRGRLSARIRRAFTDDSLAAVFDPAWGADAARTDRGNYLIDGDEHYVRIERSAYDSRGMRVGVRDANGNTASISYDFDLGLFVAGVVDAAGHPSTVERGDFPFQVTAVIDPNANRTEFTWDPSGLPSTKSVLGKYIDGAWQGDPQTDSTEAYDYDFATLPVRISTDTRQVRLGAVRTVHRYLDGLGRTVQERHTAEPDPTTSATRVRVTGWQAYNAKGLVVRAYQPVFASSTSYSAGSTEVPSVATTYDPLGREQRVDYPDGTFESATFTAWTRERRDRNDNAGGIAPTDARYGSFLTWFAASVSTPTTVFVDALGRDIAVAESMGGTTLHVTRSVLDLKGQITSVFDARGSSTATWSFGYDDSGRRLTASHATALGTRYALPDAADNPIWARDARGIEVARTFDALNRPLTESSDDGTTVLLRRMWSYVLYDEGDAGFSDWQARNVFGRLEEERDADGIRFFVYDWRGLTTSASHRFWPQRDGSANAWNDTGTDLWTTGSAWDPGIDDADRDDITDWLDLPGLADTTTIEVVSTYDAAGRPTEVVLPGMQLRRSYNEAGLPDEVELDRDGTGYATVLNDLRYDARGKPTRQTFGSGVVSERTWDADIERLIRIYTYLPGGTPVEFQDLSYDYDPVGNPLQITDALTASTYKSNNIIPNTRTFRYDPRDRLIRATGKKHATVTRYGEPNVPSPDPADYDPYDYDYSYDEVGNFTVNDEFGGGALEYKAGRIDLFNGDSTEAINDDPALGNYTYDENGNALHTPRIGELAYTHDNQVRYTDMGGGTEVRDFRHGDQRSVRMLRKYGVKALGIYIGPFEYHYREGSTSYTKVVLRGEGFQAERVLAGADPDSVDLFYVHSDHLGSGHVLVDEAGVLLSQEEYFPYGKASDRRDSRNRYRYIGVERDDETGLSMTGPRTYDPFIGRFLQGDPLAATGGSRTPFHYCGGNPVSRADTSGYTDRAATSASAPTYQDEDNPDVCPAPRAGPPTVSIFGRTYEVVPDSFIGPLTRDQLRQADADRGLKAMADSPKMLPDRDYAIRKAAADWLVANPRPLSTGDDSDRVASAMWDAKALSFARELGTTGGSSTSGTGETFYRRMSEGDAYQLILTGRVPATSETMITPSAQYANRYRGVLVRLTVRPGTTEQLSQIGVRDSSKATALAYPNMPLVGQDGWTSSSAYFKNERGQLNIGLGEGEALETFNDNLEIYEVFLP